MTTTWDAHRSELPTLLGAIGRTPLVRLQRVTPPGVDILAKVEWYGPTGSVKDRIYAHMLDQGRGARRAQARDDDHRVHHRQRRDRLLGGGGDQGVPVRHRDARRHELGAQDDDQGVRGGPGAHARRRHRHRPGDRPDARDRRRRPRPVLLPRGVREPRQPRGAARERAGDLGAERRSRRRRRGRPGDRRVDQRRGAGAEAAQPGCARVRGGAGGMPADQRTTMGHPRCPRDRRRHRAAEPRPRGDGRHRHRLHAGSVGDGAPPRSRGRAALRPLVGHQRRGGAQGERAAPRAAPDRHRGLRHRAAVPVGRALRRVRSGRGTRTRSHDRRRPPPPRSTGTATGSSSSPEAVRAGLRCRC